MRKQQTGGAQARRLLRLLCSIPLLVLALPAMTAPNDTWDLTDLYPDLASWQTAHSTIKQQVAELEQCRGTLATSADTLARCLQQSSAIYRALTRLYSYSFLAKDIELANSTLREQHSLAEDLLTAYGEAISFIEPELLAIDRVTLQRWQRDNRALDDYDFFIRNTQRKAAHILPVREEQMLAAASAPLRVAGDTYSVLTNAELPWPTITLADGQQATLTPAAYTKFRGTQNRADRRAVFNSFFGTYQKYQQTLAVTLEGQVRAHVFEARMRNYPSALQQALALDNIPEQVYRSLVTAVNNNLPTLHRYLKLRAKLQNLSDPRYYDIYPDVLNIDKTYPITDAERLLDTALAPLGKDYQQLYRDSVGARWMHIYPAQGKVSGAYSMGAAYDVHPYILLNHNDDYDSLSTFAHEWGHAMHSLLANRTQPFARAEYTTFTAEIASTAHEVLLYNQLTAAASDTQERLFYLLQELDGLRGTFFRQTQFAEFELQLHEEIEKGGALSADKLNALYGALLKRYYGHQNGVMHIDDNYTVEWAYIPHFYRNFYVYQYATSISAAYYLMDKVLAGGEKERQQYLSILKAGGSDYPYELLRKAGVDMASPEVYQAVITRCDKLMDEIERIIEQADEMPKSTK